MGARITFLLVAAAALTLAAGFVTHTPALIYASIVCSALAAIGLLLSSRRRGSGAKGEDLSWPASLAETDTGDSTAPQPVLSVDALADHDSEASVPAFALAGGRPTRRRSPPSERALPGDTDPETGQFAAAAGLPPRSGSKKRNPVVADWVQAPSSSAAPTVEARPLDPIERVRPIRPAVVREDAARRPRPLVAVRTAPPNGAGGDVAPTSPADPSAAPVRRRIVRDDRTDRPAAPRGPVVAARQPARPSTSPARQGAPAPAGRRAPRVARRQTPTGEYPFPIEDYDDLSVAEIIPLLPELDDQELVDVLLYEQAAANRVGILNRIDVLLEGEDI